MSKAVFKNYKFFIPILSLESFTYFHKLQGNFRKAGSSGRAPAYQVQSPEFQPQHHQQGWGEGDFRWGLADFGNHWASIQVGQTISSDSCSTLIDINLGQGTRPFWPSVFFICKMEMEDPSLGCWRALRHPQVASKVQVLWSASSWQEEPVYGDSRECWIWHSRPCVWILTGPLTRSMTLDKSWDHLLMASMTSHL
jgi:hypothetical protein